ISDSDRRDLPNHLVRRYRTVRADGQLQEIRYLPELHTGRADGGTDQSPSDDRSIGSLYRKRSDWRPERDDHSVDQDPSRRDDTGNSVRRRDGHGRPDSGPDQAGHQWLAGAVATAGSRLAVPQPRLRQQPDRTDGS